MSEHPGQPHPDPEREREESTDLGYRDTEEERAYERAAESDSPVEPDGTEGSIGRD